MDLSFSWLLNNRPLALREVVAPAAASFSVVQPSELEDASEFIQPHSLVLTVGIAFRGREHELGRYIDHLADAGAVAVGFGTGLTFPAVPDVVAETARRRGIGLFEVPRRIPFISIVTAAHQEQRRLAHIEQQRLIDAQQRLTSIATAGSLDSLLHTAAELLDARVRVTDGAGSVAGSAAVAVVGEGVRLHHSSYAMSRHHLLEVFSVAPLGAAQRALIRHCAGLADVLLARPSELRAARNELNSFALAVRLGLGGDEELLPSGFDSPTDENGLTRPIVLVADDRAGLARALGALDARAEEVGRFLYSVPLPDHAALVLVRADQPVRGILEGLGAAARRVRVGVGRPVAHPDANQVAALRSRAALLALGEHSLPDATSLPWLAEPAVRQALHARRAELFDRLGSEDARTLTVYLRHGGQLAATAEALGIHRHTARNRIARIQEVCEIDLADPAVFAEAFFASVAEESV